MSWDKNLNNESHTAKEHNMQRAPDDTGYACYIHPKCLSIRRSICIND